MTIRILLVSAPLLLAALAVPREAGAVGCITGGLAGAAAGHMVHHGVLGAIGGCVAGHEYHKHHQRSASQVQNDDDNADVAPGRRGTSTYQ